MMTAPLARWAFYNALALLVAVALVMRTEQVWLAALVGLASFGVLIVQMRGG